MEYIFYISVIVIAYKIGWLAREYHAMATINKMNNIKMFKERHGDIIPIVVEKHEDTFYVYDGLEKTFMAQGKTRKDLEIALDIRFPGKKYAAQPSNLKEIGL
jgi:hypothetical protein